MISYVVVAGIFFIGGFVVSWLIARKNLSKVEATLNEAKAVIASIKK